MIMMSELVLFVSWLLIHVESKTELTASYRKLSVNVTLVLYCGEVVPWNDDSILVILQLEGEGVLLGVLSGRNASAGLRVLDVLHEFKVHI